MNNTSSTPWLLPQHLIIYFQDYLPPTNFQRDPGRNVIPTPTQRGPGGEHVSAPILRVVQRRKRYIKRLRCIFSSLNWIVLLLISIISNIVLAYLVKEIFTGVQLSPWFRYLNDHKDVWNHGLPCRGRNYRPDYPKADEDGICFSCRPKVDAITTYEYGSPQNDLCCYPQQESTQVLATIMMMTMVSTSF